MSVLYNVNLKLYFNSFYFTGSVRSFVHSSSAPKQLSDESLGVIANDLNFAFSMDAKDDHARRTNGAYRIKTRTVKVDHIKEVYVFTWLRMAHKLTVSLIFLTNSLRLLSDSET